MDFISSLFLFYFLPLVLLVFHFSPKEKQKLVLILASILFYAWGATWYVFVLLFLLSADFWLANSQKESATGTQKKYLIASILLNLLPLIYYKLVHISFNPSNIWLQYAMPFGLTIITLQRIGYAVDVFRNPHCHLDKIEDYALYHLFFPKLITGPLTTLSDFGKQISDFKKPAVLDSLAIGGQRFAIGFIKKILLVTCLSEFSKQGFDHLGAISTPSAWLTVLAFGLQVFIELCAYADMAIGLGLLFGFGLTENFSHPFTASGIAGFWRNWFVSLHLWYKSYLLAWVSTFSKNRILATVCAFAFTGILFGVNLSTLFFILYSIGIYTLDQKFLTPIWSKIGEIPSAIATFVLLSFGWIFIRFANLNTSLTCIKTLFGSSDNSFDLLPDRKFWFLFMIGVALVLWEKLPKINTLSHTSIAKNTYLTIAIGLLFILSIAYSTTNNIEAYTFLSF